jgi:WD40 repeat protein
LQGHESWVWSVAFVPTPDGSPALVSAGWDGSLRLWQYQA